MSAQNPPPAADRRRFIKAGACLACAAWLGGCRGGESVSSNPVAIVPLGPAASYPHGATVRRIERLVVVRDKGGFGAMSLRCTHQECLVNYGGSGEISRCPCHGATFSPTGRVLSGPAPRDLPWYAVSISSSGILEVTIGAVVPPDQRYPDVAPRPPLAPATDAGVGT